MASSRFKTDCILNNKDKLGLVCQDNLDGYDDVQNAQRNKIRTDQVTYFLSHCPLYDVSSNVKHVICNKKYEEKNMTFVLNFLPKYKPSQVEVAYKNCPPDSSARQMICIKRYTYLMSVDAVQKYYANYKAEDIMKIYNECDIPEKIRKSICSLKSALSWLQISGIFGGLYGYNKVEKIYAVC